MTKSPRSLYVVCLIGLAVRLAFILYGAKIYFGRDDIFVDNDTSAWRVCIQNLIDHGVYTLNPQHEYGFFGRMPGFSFFMGLFYLVFGRDWDMAYKAIGWFQMLLDVFTIALVYKIAQRLFGSPRMATVTALVYAVYPFVIVWTPVVYSEYMSVFFMIVALYFLTHPERRFYFGWAGAALGLGALFRPQLLLLLPLVGLYLLYKYRRNTALLLKRGALYGLMVVLTYGLWPLRNYVMHGKIVLTQDLRGIKNWNKDVIAYMQYIYSVKPEWDPQFTQIIRNEPVEMPAAAFAVKEDSALVVRALELSKTCGSGFSHWSGYWKESFEEPNCNEEIAALYDKLRMNAMRQQPFHYYVTLPLLNLKKAIFKTTLNDTSTPARKAASLLFLYRTLMLLLGLIGCVLLIRQRHQGAWFAGLCLGFFALLYLALCAGTGPQYRNIEMRYFLHPDLLLLFPASWLLVRSYEFFRRKTNAA
jgi:hypothetical protein